MINIKKWLCMLMTLALIAGCTACGSKGEDTGNTEKSQDVLAESESGEGQTEESNVDPLGKYDEPVTVTFGRTAVIGSTVQFDENDPDKKSWSENRWVSAYKDYLNVDMEYKWLVSDSESNTAKWAAAIANGDTPDAAYVSDEIYQQLLDAGLVADMTELFAEYASEDYLGMLNDSLIEQMTIDGRMMGLPFPNKAYHGSNILYIRKDWLDQLNLPVPTSITEIEQTAQAFVDARLGGDETMGILFGQDMAWANEGKWEGYVNGYGAYINLWIEKDGELVYSTIQPEMREALLGMQELYRKGLTNPDIAVATNEQLDKYVANGQAGMWYGTGWASVYGTVALCESNPEADIVSIYPPGLNSGEEIVVQSESPTVRRIFVSSKCEHPEAVIKMLNLTAKLETENPTEYSRDEDIA